MASAIFLLRKGVEVATPPCIMNVDDLQCSWLEDVKARYRDLQGQPEDARLWLVATDENSGIWGLVQSIRWESGSEKVRCVHVSNRNPGSKVPKLAADSAEFKELMKKDLVNNVYRDGRWGTYKTMVIHEGKFYEFLTTKYKFKNFIFNSPRQTNITNESVKIKMRCTQKYLNAFR